MANPFLKIVGGKRQLMPYIRPLVPKEFDTYIEPFVGGGAVFFSLQEEGLLRGKRALLSDANVDIVDCYVTIQSDVNGLIDELEGLCRTAEVVGAELFYYQLRDVAQPSGPASRAARFLYLNAAAFNGVIRYNRQGKFNTPIGRDNKGVVRLPTFDTENLKAVWKALQGVTICQRQFDRAFACRTRRSFIYLDPPYTGGFTAYTSDGWAEADDKDLLFDCNLAQREGANILLSSGVKGTMEDLARRHLDDSRYKIERIEARRAVNSEGHNRGEVSELIFCIGEEWVR